MIVLGFSFFSTNKKLGTAKEAINLAQSDLEIKLMNRSEELPNMVEITKQHAAHDEKIYKSLEEARKGLSTSIETGDLDKIMESNEELELALTNLVSLKEDNPELKADESFKDLRNTLKECQQQIVYQQRVYNEKVRKYKQFFMEDFFVMVEAPILGYKETDYGYIKVSKESLENPKISFD